MLEQGKFCSAPMIAVTQLHQSPISTKEIRGLTTFESRVQQDPLEDLEAASGGGIFSADKWIAVVYPAVY